MIPESIARIPLAALLLGGLAPSVSAHPHAWIDVKTTVILSAPYTVSAIREEWTFDKLYTSTLLKDASGKWKPLTEFVETAMRHLAPYHYFLELHSDGIVPAIGVAIDAEGEVRDDSLILRFTAPIATPLDISHSDLTLAVCG